MVGVCALSRHGGRVNVVRAACFHLKKYGALYLSYSHVYGYENMCTVYLDGWRGVENEILRRVSPVNSDK